MALVNGFVLLFLAIKMQKIIDFSVSSSRQDNFVVHLIVEFLEKSDHWCFVSFFDEKTRIQEVDVELSLVANRGKLS